MHADMQNSISMPFPGIPVINPRKCRFSELFFNMLYH